MSTAVKFSSPTCCCRILKTAQYILQVSSSCKTHYSITRVTRGTPLPFLAFGYLPAISGSAQSACPFLLAPRHVNCKHSLTISHLACVCSKGLEASWGRVQLGAALEAVWGNVSELCPANVIPTSESGEPFPFGSHCLHRFLMATQASCLKVAYNGCQLGKCPPRGNPFVIS